VKFSDIKLDSIGQEVQLVGGIWAGAGQAYLFYFPEYGQEFPATNVEMTSEDWQALIKQSDVVETEVMARAENGDLVKVVMRKCERLSSQEITWNVFRRDNYCCRYCGNNRVPLTVDHLVLWEDGGPTIEANLTAACRKCNKTRGRMHYEQWLRHPYYLQVSRKLSAAQIEANETLVATLAAIPRVHHVKSR